MKKIILKSLQIVILFTFISQQSNAQKWDVNGNTIGGTEYLGSNNSQPIEFTTQGGSSLMQMELQTTGDLNLFQTTYNNSASQTGYKIGDNLVLWHNGTVDNIFVGVNAGSSKITGSSNTFVGYKASSDSMNIFNATAIGANARVNIDNGFVLGTDKTNVGIRTTTPQYTLEVHGTIAAEQLLILKENKIENLQTTIADLQKRLALLENKMIAMQQLTAKN